MPMTAASIPFGKNLPIRLSAGGEPFLAFACGFPCVSPSSLRSCSNSTALFGLALRRRSSVNRSLELGCVKGWFRMIGTIVGTTMIAVLPACFPRNRIAFLSPLALWVSLCAFSAILLRNFASYAAALAGHSAGIIAGDKPWRYCRRQFLKSLYWQSRARAGSASESCAPALCLP
jgi:Fusaric acid resistance protein family